MKTVLPHRVMGIAGNVAQIDALVLDWLQIARQRRAADAHADNRRHHQGMQPHGKTSCSGGLATCPAFTVALHLVCGAT